MKVLIFDILIKVNRAGPDFKISFNRHFLCHSIQNEIPYHYPVDV